MENSDGLAGALASVRERVSRAAQRAGRDPREIVLVAASKAVPAERLRQAWGAGLTRFGENRAQELKEKQAALADLAVEWHFIGHLQRNKVKDVAGKVALLHSLDRWELALDLERHLSALGRLQPVLVQVNSSGESSKSGVAPGDALDFVRRVAGLPHLEVHGLMTIARLDPDPEQARHCFRLLRELRDQIAAAAIPGVRMEWLSMGMSGDFEIAVEEGANLIRLGTAIFGPRPPRS